MTPRPWFAFAVFATLLPILTDGSLPAQEVEKAAEKPAAQEAVDADTLFVVPAEDDVAKLARFLQRLIEFRPQSRDDRQAYLRKAPLAMRKAAEKIVALEKDQASKNYRMAKRHLLSEKATKLTESEDAAAGDHKKLLDELLVFIRAGDRGREDAGLATNFAIGVEYSSARDLAPEAYAKLGALLEESKDEELARRGKMLSGAARRLNLVGQPLELKGATLAGEPFDLASLKGKVVLVDFWATWCGPCLAEIPNLKKNYEAYKDKGFEVVGVSIDEDRPALEEFLQKSKLPWITLHDKENMGQHPATTELGIFGIPCVILVGKDGKVISTRARGEELGRHLKELLATEP